MINSRKIQMVIILILIVLIGLFFLWVNFRSVNVSSPELMIIDASNKENDTKYYAGIISTTTNALNTYTSTQYGIQFEYPATWKVGDNALGIGTFQLFNYDSTHSSGSVFATGTNKVEAVISSENTYGTSSDYSEKSRATKKITISGQPAILADIELGGQHVRNYSIELPSLKGKFFSISIYGETDNFVALDEIVKTIIWVPVTVPQ